MKTPRELSQDLILMSDEYSKCQDALANLDEESARHFFLNRDLFKSDKSCERAFDITDSGIARNRLSRKLKGMEKQMSAIKTHLHLLDNEARNVW